MRLPEDMRILVVDDEASVRTVIAQVLEEDGFRVTEAASGDIALQLFEEEPFQVVITDIVMPGISGIDLLKTIKTRYPASEVIIITSHASLDTAVEALRCGAYDYLFKPFKDLNLISMAAKRAVEKIGLTAENRMLVAKLKGQNADLEGRVKKRTGELEKINDQLLKEIQERIRAQDAAETANRAKSEFLANMSRELRTPLDHIIGFAQIILSKYFGELNEVQEEYLHDVMESGKYLMSLINNLLDLSQVEAGRLKLSTANVNINALLKKSFGIFTEQASKSNIKLSMDVDGVNGSIKADEGKLMQILDNLLANAVKYTPDGGTVRLNAWMLSDCLARPGQRWGDPEDLKVICDPVRKNTTTASGDRQGIWISVSDTGVGISPKNKDRIFDRFEQAEGSSQQRSQGNGLGLSLTKILVEKHGGKIWVESEGEGKGSTFNVVIPV